MIRFENIRYSLENLKTVIGTKIYVTSTNGYFDPNMYLVEDILAICFGLFTETNKRPNIRNVNMYSKYLCQFHAVSERT